MFCKEMIELFQKIPVALPKPVDYRKKLNFLLTCIGGERFIEKYKPKLPLVKSPTLRKEAQKKEGNIKKI